MADTLRVPSNDKPTFWNRGIGLGASIGFLASGFVGAIAGPLGGGAVAALELGTIAAGGIIGGAAGQSRMENEAEFGKEIKQPTFWNRGILTGAALGKLAMVGVLLVTAIATVGVASLNPAAALGVLGVGLVATLASPIVGGILGGIAGKNRMGREYKEAQEYVAMHGEYKGRGYEMAKGQAVVPQRNYTVTPEEAALLESRLSGGRDTSFSDRARTQPQVQPAQP